MSAKRIVWLPFVVLAGAVGLHWAASERPAVAAAPAEEPQNPVPFLFVQEFYGSGGYKDPQARLNYLDGLMNGLAFWPPAESAAAAIVDGVGGLVLRMPAASSGVGSQSREALETQLASLANLLPQPRRNATFWNLMPEWDQSGGDWVSGGRPRYAGLTRAEAYRRFRGFYATAHPNLDWFLRQTSSPNAPFQTAAITDHSANVFYAYEMGVDLQMLERGIDELGDLSTGIAFLRGAAGQHGKPWGIDISTWRTTNNGATRFDESGRLRSGWSASYVERLYYLAFAAGAQVIHNEAVTYRFADGRLNPLGEVTRQFADFALRRHPDLGRPSVNVAILMDPVAGFEPKHGVHNQASAVWYQDIGYSSGDRMTDNFLKVAYPAHWLHGLAPGAPFANGRGEPAPKAFEEFLARGGDPRPFEPMPSTRWGDNIDVLTTEVDAARLRNYKAVVLMGDVQLPARLRNQLRDWVSAGGLLVLNAAQATREDEELAGVRIVDRSPLTASQSRWLHSAGEAQREPAFHYWRVDPGDSEVLAVTGTGDPLITRRTVGTGEVLFTTPLYLQSASQGELLNLGTALLDRIFSRFEPVIVEGPPVEFVLGRNEGNMFVTLANHASTPWRGKLRLARGAGASELVTDTQLGTSNESGQAVVAVSVPAFGVRIVRIESE